MNPDPIYQAAQKVVARAQKLLVKGQPLTADSIHELRVCTKKLRALLQLYRPFCSKTAIKAVEQKLKRLADAFAGTRDAQVQYETLCQLANLYCGDNQGDVLPVLEFFSVRKEKLKAAPDIDVEEALDAVMKTWHKKLHPKGPPGFDEGLKFSYQKASKLAFDAECCDEDGSYHECRKWVKFYLYQAQLCQYKKHEAVKLYLQSVKQLAELLGLFHDRCELENALNVLLEKKAHNSLQLESAALLMLSWLMEQKRADKENFHSYFEQLFSYSDNPIKLLC